MGVGDHLKTLISELRQPSHRRRRAGKGSIHWPSQADDGGGATTSLGCRASYLALGDVGFGKYSVDLRLTLAETYLAAGDARKALQNARNALDRSEQPDCQYAWGKADGLHWCGISHLRLGERELAVQRLTAALEIRARLGHGRSGETRRALELCRT